MTKNEQRVSGLVCGLLVVLLLEWLWKPISDSIRILLYLMLLIGSLVTYVQWLHAKRVARSWLAPVTFLGCLLLAAGVEMSVYQRAQVVSYTRDVGWTSDTIYYTAEYDGEEEALALLLGGPLVGVLFLALYSGSEQRRWQFRHYIVLLITCYPFAAIILFSSIGDKPRYYEGSSLPFVADSLRLVHKNLPSRIYPDKR